MAYGFTEDAITTTRGVAEATGADLPQKRSQKLPPLFLGPSPMTNSEGLAETSEAGSGGKTKDENPTHPKQNLGENLLQINVYLDNLSEQIIATTATYAPVI